MATSQSLSPNDKSSTAPVSTLDESLAQLEEALDLFVSRQSDEDSLDSEHTSEVTPITAANFQTPVPEELPNEPASVDPPAPETPAEIRKKITLPVSNLAPQWSTSDVMVIPVDDEAGSKRRYPIFTDTQKRLFWMLAGFLVFFGLIGFLLWQQQKKDEEKQAANKLEELYARPLSIPTPSGTADPGSLPADSPSTATADVSNDDKLLGDNIRQILLAYNPTAVGTRYKIDVKDGVVTLTGEAQSQMEKEGAENVIKPLQGIKKVVNSLIVKNLVSPPGGVIASGGVNGPVMYPKVNEAEAKKLEEALKRDLAEGAKRAEEERLKIEQQNAQLNAQRTAEESAKQEAERLRRQQAATLQYEEANRLRQQNEERLRKEKEDNDRRLEEQRQAEAARAPRPEAARPSAPELHTGTVRWDGIVKGVEDIVIHGSSASINHVSGDSVQSPRASFSAAIPNSPLGVRLVAASGKSPIRIIQQPSAANNFTTIVRVGEGTKAEGKPHSFTLRWATQ